MLDLHQLVRADSGSFAGLGRPSRPGEFGSECSDCRSTCPSPAVGSMPQIMQNLLCRRWELTSCQELCFANAMRWTDVRQAKRIERIVFIVTLVAAFEVICFEVLAQKSRRSSAFQGPPSGSFGSSELCRLSVLTFWKDFSLPEMRSHHDVSNGKPMVKSLES
mmetsp:Transcript_70276/g.164588  ORF Transcript_70276/g.164588 Transcript_70276/m.164588 type:complete len:163 (-) Transcript_70276:15-503(-)